jgi:hypothetical protein
MGLSTTCHFTASVEYRYLDQFLEYIMHLVKNTSKQEICAWIFYISKVELRRTYTYWRLMTSLLQWQTFFTGMMTCVREADRYTAVMRCN